MKTVNTEQVKEENETQGNTKCWEFKEKNI